MKKKLTKIFSINFLGAGINFITTILVVKLFGLEIFGDYVILSSLVGLFTLIYTVIPPNFAIFKLQDDKSFYNIFIFNYIFNSFIITIVLYLSTYIIDYKFNIFLILLFGILNGLMEYFNVYSQAINKSDKYFIMLFISYLAKLIFISILYFYIKIFTLDMILLLNILSLFIALIYAYYYIGFEKIVINYKNYFSFIKDNFLILRGYYTNTFLKRIKDNATVLVFSLLVNSEMIALYNLFTKITGFVLGQLRVVEAYIVNRQNLAHINITNNKIYTIGFVFQIFIILVGLVYLKISIDRYMFQELFIYSFLSYPYVNILLLRNKLLSDYNVNIINGMYLLYLSCLLIFSCIFYFIGTNLLYILIFIVLSEIINVIYLKLKQKIKALNYE